MNQKKISLGLNYSIDGNETNRFLKRLHSDLLDYLNDAPNSFPNLYNGITSLNYQKITDGGTKQILQSFITATIQFFPLPLPAAMPVDLEVSRRKQINFTEFSIINFEYNVGLQTLSIEVLLHVEDLYLIDTYSNKLIVIDLAEVANFTNNLQVASYTIIDNDNLAILKLN